VRRNWAARLREITIEGMRALVLENERLRVTVLADKGGDVVEFLHKPSDTDLVWLSPQGLRRPLPPQAADDVGAFVDHYEGGWQEVFPNGGAPSVYRGARLAQHGEVAGLPWSVEVLTDTAREVAVRLAVRTRRLPYRVEKTFRLASGTAALEVEGRVTNEAPVALHAMWGHHLAFGRPFLRPGARIRVPEGVRVIPHATSIDPQGRRAEELFTVPPPGSPSEIVYLTGFDTGWYEVASQVGLRVEWDAEVMPYLWLWQELGASTDWPWWGGAYVVGLEPFSSMPTDGLSAAVDNGTAMLLGPAQSRTSRLRVEVIA
jgi:galactose mutarotase-like enzyme